MSKIIRPQINPTFFYDPIISYKFHGDISVDKGKYRFRFTLFFKSGDVFKTQKSGFKTYAEASKAKEVAIADLVRNEYIPFEYTVKEFFDYWLYHHMIVEKKIAYNTFQSYRNILYNHLMPELKGETELIRVRIEDLVKTVEKIEFSTVKDAAAKLIVEIFTFAHDQHYISFNPALAAYQQLKKQLMKKKKRNVINTGKPNLRNIRTEVFGC